MGLRQILGTTVQPTLKPLLSCFCNSHTWFGNLCTMSCIGLTYLYDRLPSIVHLQSSSLGDHGVTHCIPDVFCYLVKDEDRICAASSRYESKLAFMNFRAFLQ